MGRLDPQRRRGPQGRQNPRIPHSVPIPAGGGRTRAGGRGREPTPHPTNPGAGVRWRGRSGATGRDGEGDKGGGGKDGDGIRGRGNPAEHPTGAAPAAAAGGLVGRDRASRGGGESNDAGYSPAQTPVADQAALEGARVRARMAPASGTNQQTAGGGDTPRSAGATGRTADEAMAERSPP